MQSTATKHWQTTQTQKRENIFSREPKEMVSWDGDGEWGMGWCQKKIWKPYHFICVCVLKYGINSTILLISVQFIHL